MKMGVQVHIPQQQLHSDKPPTGIVVESKASAKAEASTDILCK